MEWLGQRNDVCMNETVQTLTAFDLARPAQNQLAQGFLQWCVVAPDLESKCAELERVYGPAGFWIMENAPLLETTYRGKPIDLRVDMALGYIGDTNIEVISPRRDGDANLYTEFLDEQPEGGLHHLGFQVHDFEATAADLTATFGPAVQAGNFSTGGSHFAYFDSRPVTGVHTEILWFDTETIAAMADLRAGKPPVI
ncbi:VOC family protein [Streptomyces sp. AK02-01A]|uniref:VOC family protein n=1 Tax=Streptomyces sp. AK02-01A TaxID=3028648 RepID=UPI0029A09AD3|nr:VOC family protein [Streptomyces sp. AK02-01A]MDX3853090.1 VOC family protein [Streptomyces sp. AK02-01A]